MLNVLRKGAAGWVARVFLGLLVLSFAVWGIEDIFRIARGADNAAVVGERSISVEEFRNAYNNELRRVSNQAKRVITPEEARAAGLGQRVLRDLMNEAAIDAKIKTLNLSLSDAEVARQVQAEDMFKGPTGSFDTTTFREILRQNNLSENSYLVLQRSSSVRRQLIDALMVNLEAPDAFRRAIHAYNSDSRTISYLDFKPEEPSSLPAPKAEALRAFFDERKASFAAPEYRKIAILSLDPKDIAARKTIPETELRAYFDKNRPQFGDLEKRSIEQIPFPSPADAQKAYDEIKGGQKLFEQVMLERKLKPEDVYLGDLTKSQMLDQKIADAAFKLPKGEVSAPVQGAFATVLLRITGIQEEKAKPFGDVREEIRAVIAQETAGKEALAIHDKIDEARLGGATLEEAAKANGLTVRVVDAVDSAGLAPSGQAVEALPMQDRLLAAAFRTEAGAVPETLSEGEAYAWFDIRGVTPPRERSFDEARAAAEQRWREDESGKRLAARADGALAELRAGKPLDQVASAQKLDVEQSETTRLGGAPAITQNQAKAIFQTPVDGFGQTPTDDKGGRLVYKVTAETERPYEPGKVEDGGQIERISQSIGNDLVSALVSQLKAQLGATVDEKAVARVLGTAG